MATLRPQLEIIANRHRAVMKVCHERLDRLSDEQLKWSPDPKTWSILLIADHLIKVHAATSPAFMRALHEVSRAENEGEKELPYSFSDRLFVQLLSPGARFKLPVPKLYQPVLHTGPPHLVIARLEEEFEAFDVILGYANDKKLKGVRVLSPAGSARPSIIAFLDATVQHNRYHWLQIETLMRTREFPKS